MTLNETVQKIVADLGGKMTDKNGVLTVDSMIAERKAFLSRKRLSYIFKVKIDDQAKIVKFFEMLKEAGSGLSSGGGFDSDMSPGFGFKTESYNTTRGARQGTIEESSTLFGKTYQYKFDYGKVRKEIETAANADGYKFEYQILPTGL